jgi:hypothetical protein
MRKLPRALMVVSLISAFACAQSVSPVAEEQMAQAVNCETAQADIATLEAERASVGQQVSAGLRSVVPVAAVAGLVRGDTKDRASVATGAYNEQIDEKILEIRLACGVPDQELTEEGLYPVSSARVGFAAIKPGTDLGIYRRLMIPEVLVSYKDDRNNNELGDREIADLRRYFHEELAKELQEKGGYQIVNEPGEDVLFVRTWLMDLLVKAPPEPTSARSRVYVASAGEVTLIMELRDSTTGELLARAADRREVSAPGQGLQRSVSVTNVREVRRLFAHWARLLRERLDAAPTPEETRG